MNRFQAAAQAIQREMKRLEGLAEARDILGEVGSLEQAAAESKLRLDNIQRDEHAARERLAAVEASIAAGKRTASQTLADAEAQAAQIITRAEEIAAAKVVDAETRAQEIHTSARAREQELAGRAARLADAVRAVS
jgi:hypothetical protein